MTLCATQTKATAARMRELRGSALQAAGVGFPAHQLIGRQFEFVYQTKLRHSILSGVVTGILFSRPAESQELFDTSSLKLQIHPIRIEGSVVDGLEYSHDRWQWIDSGGIRHAGELCFP